MPMRDDQMLRLSHSEWSEFFLKDLNAMRQAEHMCDTKILLKDDVTLPAHSCVLAAASPMLKSLLSDTDYPEIDMSEFPADLMAQVVEFIYTGEILVSRGDVELMCSIAESLEISVLTHIISGVFSSLHQSKHAAPEETYIDISPISTPQTTPLRPPPRAPETPPRAPQATSPQTPLQAPETPLQAPEIPPRAPETPPQAPATPPRAPETPPRAIPLTPPQATLATPPRVPIATPPRVSLASPPQGDCASRQTQPLASQQAKLPTKPHTKQPARPQESPKAIPIKRGRGRPPKVPPVINVDSCTQGPPKTPLNTRKVKQERLDPSYKESGLMLGACDDNNEDDENVKLTDAATILNSLLVNMMADNQTFLSTMSDDDDHTGYTPKQKYEIINANEGVRPVGNRKNWNSLRNPVTYENIKITADGSIPDRAEKTLPPCLTLGLINDEESIRGVFTLKALTKGSTFGPYEGETVYNQQVAEKSQYCWRIFKNCKLLHWICGEDESKSNWMRFVRVAETPKCQNIEAFQNEGYIYFRSMKAITANQELLVRYGNQYTSRLTAKVVHQNEAQISVAESTLDGFKCERCDRMFSTDLMYWKHVRAIHGDPMPVEIYTRIQMERDRNKQNRVDCDVLIKTETTEANEQADEEFRGGIPEDSKVEEENLSDPEYIPSQSESPPHKKSKRIKVEKDKSGSPKKKRGRPRKYMDPAFENENNECPVCHRTFVTRAVLRQHAIIHTGEKAWNCHLCDKAYTQRGNLQLHIMSHTGERPHVCNICGKDFSRRSEFKKHLVRHQGHRPFKCQTCGKAFGDWGNLHRHKMIHTGEKPFKCHICGSGFSQSSNLRTHIKRHTGEKSHRCSMCNKCFGDLSHLQSHLRRHTGEKPFICQYCGKGFVEKQAMQKHTERHIKKNEIVKKLENNEVQAIDENGEQVKIVTVSEIDADDYIVVTPIDDLPTADNVLPVTFVS